MLKKLKENKAKTQNRFYATDLLQEPSGTRGVLRALSNTQGGAFRDNSLPRL